MAKLGDQLVAGRLTRTERVGIKQANRRAGLQYAKEKADFEKLRSQAVEKQETEFSGLTTVDEYKQKYNVLDPSLQQFFETPTNLQVRKTADIKATAEKLKN